MEVLCLTCLSSTALRQHVCYIRNFTVIKSDFEILADLRLVDARALFEARQFDGAYY
jgi:hypothetical protein